MNLNTFESDISKKTYPVSEKISGKEIRPSILKIIQEDFPEFSEKNDISLSELNIYRNKYIAEAQVSQNNEIEYLTQKVHQAITDKTTISEVLAEDNEDHLTVGQKVADKVALFGGSWVFIISFFVFLFIWILINILWLSNKGFDPYPFILLNLILSCIAAMQAPVIMMSQNRQEEKDRSRSKKDYMVNLKSELEIQALHEKLDHLIIHQHQYLLEIQKIQMDMMNDILNRLPNLNPETKNH